MAVQVGTPICVPSQGGVDLGKIASLELNHKPVDRAKRGESVAMKIEATNTTEATRLYGRHFDFKARLSSFSTALLPTLGSHACKCLFNGVAALVGFAGCSDPDLTESSTVLKCL